MIGVSEKEEMLRDPNARTQQIKTVMIRWPVHSNLAGQRQ
jgi:hypothetical protein